MNEGDDYGMGRYEETVGLDGSQNRPALTQPDGTWCDDCHGYTHMPWCPEYEAVTTPTDAPLAQLPLEHAPLKSLEQADAGRSAVRNYELIPSRRQHFLGPLSEDVEFRSLPLLLRAVADWMDDNGLQDPEFDGLLIDRVFPTEGDDESRHVATLFYRLEGDK